MPIDHSQLCTILSALGSGHVFVATELVGVSSWHGRILKHRSNSFVSAAMWYLVLWVELQVVRFRVCCHTLSFLAEISQFPCIALRQAMWIVRTVLERNINSLNSNIYDSALRIRDWFQKPCYLANRLITRKVSSISQPMTNTERWQPVNYLADSLVLMYLVWFNSVKDSGGRMALVQEQPDCQQLSRWRTT